MQSSFLSGRSVSAEKKRAMRKVSRAAETAAVAARVRNVAITDALELGSIREVAEAAGLSPARIHQIRHGR